MSKSLDELWAGIAEENLHSEVRIGPAAVGNEKPRVFCRCGNFTITDGAGRRSCLRCDWEETNH
jgi:hypothetical protein